MNELIQFYKIVYIIVFCGNPNYLNTLATIFSKDSSFRSTKENAFLILCWVSCVLQAEKFEIFSVMGRSVVDANLAPPKIYAEAVRSAGNWYGLWPRFHDAQAQNGQVKI